MLTLSFLQLFRKCIISNTSHGRCSFCSFISDLPQAPLILVGVWISLLTFCVLILHYSNVVNDTLTSFSVSDFSGILSAFSSTMASSRVSVCSGLTSLRLFPVVDSPTTPSIAAWTTSKSSVSATVHVYLRIWYLLLLATSILEYHNLQLYIRNPLSLLLQLPTCLLYYLIFRIGSCSQFHSHGYFTSDFVQDTKSICLLLVLCTYYTECQ